MDHEFRLPSLVNRNFFFLFFFPYHVNTLEFVSSLSVFSFFPVSSLWLVYMLLVEVLLTAHVKQSHTGFTALLPLVQGLYPLCFIVWHSTCE